MCSKSYVSRCAGGIALLAASLLTLQLQAQSNVTIRVMASNLTSGNFQRYETPGLDILRGLQPDIVAMQEFNVTNQFGINTTAAISNMVATTFGTNFSYFRETNSGYSIPNGIISRYPILSSGSWPSDISDRGYAWARIGLPGTNNLYFVSVHLKASSGSASQRASEAIVVKSNILALFPANAWVLVAGDMNLFSESESAITTFRTFLSDSPVPADQNGGTNTNASRSERYDRVLPSFSMTNTLIPVVMPSRSYTNGLVFDSRVYTPLTDVPPVVSGDSGATGMQHMGVVKDFRIALLVTNIIAVNPPVLTFELPGVLRWQGVSNLTYTILSSSNLTSWITNGTATSATASFSFTNLIGNNSQNYFRVVYYSP